LLPSNPFSLNRIFASSAGDADASAIKEDAFQRGIQTIDLRRDTGGIIKGAGIGNAREIGRFQQMPRQAEPDINKLPVIEASIFL